MPRTRTAARERETICDLCEQSVDPERTLTVETDADDRTLCSFCARSLFDVESGPVRVDTSENTEPERQLAPTEGERARDVAWRPTRRRGDGLTGALLHYHRLSLSLLWAVHRTNVRLIERVLDDVDTQTVVTMGMLLATVTTVALVAVAIAA